MSIYANMMTKRLGDQYSMICTQLYDGSGLLRSPSCRLARQAARMQGTKTDETMRSLVLSRFWQLERMAMTMSMATPHGCFPIAGARRSKQGKTPPGGCSYGSDPPSELLSTIVTTPLLQADTEQVIWQKEEIDATGLQFLEWMREIRHRGTFSRVALALASLVDAVKKNEASRPLVDKWLTVSLIVRSRPDLRSWNWQLSWMTRSRPHDDQLPCLIVYWQSLEAMSHC